MSPVNGSTCGTCEGPNEYCDFEDNICVDGCANFDCGSPLLPSGALTDCGECLPGYYCDLGVNSSTCVESQTSPDENCNNNVDDHGDGPVDCEGPDCENTWDCLTGGQEGGGDSICAEGLGYEGRSSSNTLTWCANGETVSIDCVIGCGVWLADQEFNDCLSEVKPNQVPEPTGTYPLNCP